MPFRFWMTRSAGILVFPAMLAAEIVMLFTSRQWQFEWDWAVEQASFGAVVVAPLVAGASAYDRSRRAAPTLAELARTSPRGWVNDLAIAGAAAVYGIVAWGIGLAIALARCFSADAPWHLDPWTLPEAPALIVLASALGTLIGARWTSILAAPGAAVATVGARILASTWWSTWFFSVLPPNGSMAPFDVVPQLVAVVVVSHLVLACVFMAAAALWTGRFHLTRRDLAVRGSVVAVVLVGVLVGFDRATASGDYLRSTTTPTTCTTSGAVQICGPVKGGYTLGVAAVSMDEALTALEGSGIEWQTTYRLASAADFPADEGELTADTELISNGRLSTDDVLYTLASPRRCAALYDDDPPEKLLDAAGVVMDWAADRLSGTVADATAPQAVVAAYARLSTCEPASGVVG